ncbi:MAG: hypothetical protein NVSMB18_30640 [Acetobacteraceae bacterium]
MAAQFTSLIGASAATQAETLRIPGAGSPRDDVFSVGILFSGGPQVILAGPGGTRFVFTPLRTTPQAVTVAEASTGSVSPLTLAGFNPSMGTLIDGQLGVVAFVRGGAQAQNLNPTAGSLTIGQTASVRLLGADGTVLASSGTSFRDARDLAAFGGVPDFSGPSAAIVSNVDTGSAGTATLIKGALAEFETAGPLTLMASRTGTSTIAGPGNLIVDTMLRAAATATLAYDYWPNTVLYTDVATGQSGTAAVDAYIGPVAALKHQYIWSGSSNVAVAATAPNTLLKGGSGNDALVANTGVNVLDGGGGSAH